MANTGIKESEPGVVDDDFSPDAAERSRCTLSLAIYIDVIKDLGAPSAVEPWRSSDRDLGLQARDYAVRISLGSFACAISR